MDDRTKYTSLNIPRREAPSVNETAAGACSGTADTLLFTDEIFAEIEYETNPSRVVNGETAVRFFSTVTPPQAIEQRVVDPIRQKFFDMRSLATDKPFARDDAELFYRQAKFMEDFTDDFEGNAKLSMYYPYYQHMGYEQLRTYFTWRTKVRCGEMLPVSVSYVFLHVYELLSGIGVDDPTDGLEKLVAIWKTFLKYAPALENYMPRWLKDYHIYYGLPHSFMDFVNEHSMHKYYPEMFLLNGGVENSLELWNCVSDYNVTDSTFYKAGNEPLMTDCFKYVLSHILDLCGSLNIRGENLFIYRYSRVGIWYPFKQALFYPRHNIPDRRVNMLGQEFYQCKNNRWSANVPIYYSDQKSLVGGIVKKMEACLRQTMKYKYKLKAEPVHFYRSSGTPIEFDNVIEKAVAEFYKDLTHTVVTVDHANLARIRKEALGTQDKLIVPENSEFGIQNSESGDECATDASDEPGVKRLELWCGSVGASNSEFDNVWVALKNALTATEREALSIALHGGADIKAFADEKGIMLEVLADSINEKAADFIGDSILEVDEGMTIYDEYKGDVERIRNSEFGIRN